MRWLTGGSSAIVVCAVVVGCAGVPGRPTAQQVDTAQPTGSVATGQSAGDTPGEPSGETPRQPGTRPAPPVPPTPTPYVPPRRTGLPGVPGSPIKYDNTLLGAAPETAKESIESEIAGKCGADLCGVRVVLRPRGSEGCVSEISPMPVDPGGTVTVYHGPQCAEQRGELPPDLPVDPTPDVTTETDPPGTVTPETAAPGTTTGGGP